MSTPCAAVSALTVSSPSDGWQSMRMTSYWSDTLRSTRARIVSRATSFTRCTSAADRSMLAGMTSSPGTVVWMIASRGSVTVPSSRS
jgi:hypothetical protein